MKQVAHLDPTATDAARVSAITKAAADAMSSGTLTKTAVKPVIDATV